MLPQKRSVSALVREYENERVWISPRTTPDKVPHKNDFSVVGAKLICKRIFVSVFVTLFSLLHETKMVLNPLDNDKEEYMIYDSIWLAEGSMVNTMVCVSVDLKAVQRLDHVESSFIGTDATGASVRMFCFNSQDNGDYYSDRMSRLLAAVESGAPVEISARLRTVRNEQRKRVLRITVERCWLSNKEQFQAFPGFCETMKALMLDNPSVLP
jgi:hypothetical protein